MKEILSQLINHIDTEASLLQEFQPETWEHMKTLFRKDIHDLFAQNQLDSDECIEALRRLEGVQEEPVFPIRFPAHSP